MDFTQLDQVNDIIQRAGIDDKRKQRVAIRQGLSNTANLTSNYSNQITEAQQPSEFMGAGRQLASNQNVSSDIASLFDPYLTQHNNEWYYYGDTDFSKAQYGSQGYNINDLGNGKYDILGSNGQSIGTGYKSLDESLYDYAKAAAKKNITPTTTQEWIGGYKYNDPRNYVDKTYYTHPYFGSSDESGVWTGQQFNSEQEILDALEKAGEFKLESKEKYGRAISDLQRWEALGQFLVPSKQKGFGISGLFSNGNTKQLADSIQDWTYHRNFGGNEQKELIKGLDTLYGSQPLLLGDELLGYKLDTTPANVTDAKYKDPYTQYVADTSGKTQSYSMLQRQYQPGWESLISGLGDGNILVSPENAANLPGWYNADGHDYQHQSGGFIGDLASSLGPVLNLASMFVPGLQPFAVGANLINSVNNDNPLGALMSIGGAPILEGGGSVFGELRNAAGIGDFIKDISATTGIPEQALQSAGMSGLSSLFSGGDPLKAALIGGISGTAGSLVGNNYGPQWGRASNYLLSSALNNIFTNQKTSQSNTQSYLASNPQSLNNTSNKKEDDVKPKLKSLTDLYRG